MFYISRSTERFITRVVGAIALTLLCWALGQATFLPPGQAQQETFNETAPVVLDGQTLLEVGRTSQESASDRADDISEKLTRARVDDTVIVTRTGRTLYLVEELNDSEGNDSVVDDEIFREELLTVEKTDVQAFNRTNEMPLSAEQLAERWATEIETALERSREERSLAFLKRALLFALAAIVIAAIAHWWLRRIQRRVLEHPWQALQRLMHHPDSGDTQLRASLLRILGSIALILARIAIWCAAIAYVIFLFPQTRESTYEILRAVTDSLFSPVLPLGGRSYSVTDLFILMAAFLGVFLGATVVANVLRSRILNIAGIGTGSQEAIAALTRYTLIALGSLVVLQVWGLDLSSLTLLASALGVGIGFGFQNIAKDFGSGLILLFERPIQVGDFVEVSEFQGTVDRIGARSTSIKTLDQVSIIVPNSYFLENQVINWSHENPLSRIAIPVGVSYSADPEHVRKILIQAAADHSGVVRLPKPQVFFKGFGDSSLDFLLLVWIVEPNRQPSIRSDLYFQIFALFKKEGIEIPFPQRDLHVRSGHLPVSLNGTPLSAASEASLESSNINGDPSD